MVSCGGGAAGRAAERLAATTRLPATTIHRMLKCALPTPPPAGPHPSPPGGFLSLLQVLHSYLVRGLKYV